MNNPSAYKPKPLVRIIFCILILLVGVIGLVGLKNLKKPPKVAEIKEPALPVRALAVQPNDITVAINGFGQITSRTNLILSSEVAGLIDRIHPRLQVGETIAEGETLLHIDDRDYLLNLESARQRLEILQKDQKLALKEYERISELYRKNKVGSQAAVDQSERVLYSLANQISQVEQSIRQAELQVERCTITAPFTGRITAKNVARDEYVTPGKHILTFIDDRNLEIHVAVDSREATRWLNFEADGPDAQNTGWFAPLAARSVIITWTEDKEVKGMGRLDRVVTFDPKTRTVVLGILLDQQSHNGIPLASGMFCRVDIPGRILTGVFSLPRQAVTFDNKVFLAVDNRLQRRVVNVLRREQDRALIDAGLAPGDMVITTRLENPLENSLLKVNPQN